MGYTTETELSIDCTYLHTRYRSRTKVTCANDVVTNVVSLFEKTELGNFAVRVCYVVQTCNVTNNSVNCTDLQRYIRPTRNEYTC